MLRGVTINLNHWPLMVEISRAPLYTGKENAIGNGAKKLRSRIVYSRHGSVYLSSSIMGSELRNSEIKLTTHFLRYINSYVVVERVQPTNYKTAFEDVGPRYIG